MKYRVFDTEAEAITAEAQIAQAIGCVRVGLNAKTGQPAPDAQVTERWAIPQQITDGHWVFQSPDDTGVDVGADWWPKPPEYI